jgi:hypothetical protein
LNSLQQEVKPLKCCVRKCRNAAQKRLTFKDNEVRLVCNVCYELEYDGIKIFQTGLQRQEEIE